jgi:16S rRNA (cytosine967-C5)-methyltransferase
MPICNEYIVKHDDRYEALMILTSLLQDMRPLSSLMSSASPMTKELCFGFCRHYFRLEAIAYCLLDKRPKVLEVWVVLLLGLYQLHYLHKPDYAVVKATVALLDKNKKTWAKGLVNAVLRNFCRQSDKIVAEAQLNPAFIYGQSPWFLQQLQKDWPNDWQIITKAYDVHPPMTLRVNKKFTTVSDYADALLELGIESETHPIALDALTLKVPCSVDELPNFAIGWVSVQDAAAQLSVPLLALSSGLRVLDACAAPGGKTCHILESAPKLAACVAVDVDPKRLDRVKENLVRLRLEATVIQGDAGSPKAWWDGQQFDRILLDAPCSATGVIRRHADIKLLRTPDEVANIVVIQARVLEALWPLLSPGGVMVYATCSVLTCENESQVALFVAKNPDCRVSSLPWRFGRPTPHGHQILPGDYGMDGFFYSVLHKDAF